MKEELKKNLQRNNLSKDKPVRDYLLYEYFFTNQKNYNREAVFEQGNFYGGLFDLSSFLFEQLKKEKYTSHVDLDILENIAIQVYAYTLNNILSPTLTFEASLFVDGKQECENHFIQDITNQFQWQLYYFNKYPVLYFLISNCFENQIKFVNEMIGNLILDQTLIDNEFGFTGDLVNIEIAMGDFHNNNKSVCKLSYVNIGKNSIISNAFMEV